MPLTGVVLPKEVSMIDSELKEFKLSCEKPYDKHKYKINFKNGKSVTFEDYEMMKAMWYQWRTQVESVDVLDPHKKLGGGKGF